MREKLCHGPGPRICYPVADRIRGAEADPPLVACPRLLAWSMGCSEHIIGDAHGVIPFRRVFTRRIPALRCSFDITEPRSEP